MTEQTYQYQVNQIYTKNLRFFAQELTPVQLMPWRPQINLQANPHYRLLSEGQYEVILTLHIQLKQAGTPIAEIEIEQAGVFMLANTPPDQQELLLYGIGCNLLFGYAGAHVNGLLAQAELPPVYLAPLNFVDCYRRFRQNRTGSPDSQQPFSVEIQP